jgi:5,10-methylenetetrahydromethanopterin reductase
MEFGFMMGISPREPVARFSSLAALAEESGFSMAWLADSQLIVKDPYIAMTMASRATSRMKFGPGVANPITRHFSTIACTMTTLDEVSDGRAVLGIGSGDSAVSPLGMRGATIAALREQIIAIRALCSGTTTVVDGHSVQMLTGTRAIPIFLAASQPRMLQLAGEVADGVILMGAADPALTQWQLEHVARGAESAGRSLDDVFVDLWFGISISDDENQARQDVRAWATSQARWFSKWKEVPGPLGSHRAEFDEAFAAYQFSEHLSTHAEHAKLISNELVDLIAVSGNAEQCRSRIMPLLNLKVDRLTFTLLPGGRERRLRQFGEDLLPKLRQPASADR